MQCQEDSPSNVKTRPEDFDIPNHPFILFLYAGKDDNTSLASTVHDRYPWLTSWIREYDIIRDPKHDMLKGDLFYHLLQAAKKGHILAITGGPNCRTWSICLHKPERDGSDGRPMRARDNPYCWGLPDLSPEETTKTEGDSLLLMRMLAIHSLAAKHNPNVALLLEHPADPANHNKDTETASECSSIWATTLIETYQQLHNAMRTTWPQCATGMDTQKWTTILHKNLPHLRRLQSLRCNCKTHKSDPNTTSADLARWSPVFQQLIASSLAVQFQHLKHQHPKSQPADTPRDTIRQADPVQVTIGHRRRPIRDGGGKPSQGRSHPLNRPKQLLKPIGQALAAYAAMTQSVEAATTTTLQGHCKDSPYQPLHTLHAQSIICDHLHHDDLSVPTGQPFHLPLMEALARACQDPDCDYPNYVSQGVPLGVDEPLPLSPGIWPTIEELRANQDSNYNEEHEEDLDPPTQVPNYPSAEEHIEAIRQTYLEEVPLGMTIGPLTQTQAATICLCEPDQLCPGALAGKPEGRYLDKLRTIHDATINGVNKWIRRNQREKTTAPTLHDAMTALHHCPPDTILLKLDITKAHRRIKLLLKDWKYISAQLGEEVWLNTVGTYGVASAQYYWGRMAALILRITYHTIPDVLWAFVYVDDFLFLLHPTTPNNTTATIILLYMALGIPISWKKSTLGQINHWLGYHINTATLTCRIMPDKHIIIIQILHQYHCITPRTHKQLESELGKLNWALMICPPLRSMLTPMYQWLKCLENQNNTQGRPSKEVQYLARTMAETLNDQPSPIIHTDNPLNIIAATDAGADDVHATIGGWYSTETNPKKDQVHWFYLCINQTDHPWAYEKLTPQQSISAIELYGTMLLTKHLSPNAAQVQAYLPIRTDNQGNAYNVANYKAKKWPNYAILLEMALHEYKTGIHPQVNHTYRENNTWSDQLTHRDTTGFNKELEIKINESTMQWHILHKLLQLKGHKQYRTTHWPLKTTPATT